ncbi:hypothetical protein NQ318_002508 [Aromia moschata]|uniref:Microtubule-associated serine/threonine-protein kinase pre-PK domain-containing protein n=1 Tax=Aromia moschata TaxID=1265417 RepID=A0AAV8Y837_9CUCU|nr:hypothetical protein NQ318_002508 [Aromia moschata]
MSEKFGRLLTETKEKSEEAASMVTSFIKKLLLIISRPARLLECLELIRKSFIIFRSSRRPGKGGARYQS